MPVTPPPRRPSAFKRSRPAAQVTKQEASRRFWARPVTLRRRGHSRVTMSLSMVLIAATLTIAILGIPLYNFATVAHDRHQVNLELARAKAERDDLQAQLKRWSDPDFISAQARERLGYVKPGETRYKVVDPGPEYVERDAHNEEASDRPWFFALADSTVSADKRSDREREVTASRRGTPAEGATEVPTKEEQR